VTLWIVLTVLIAAASAALAIPLVRRYDARRDPDALSVLLQQLDEIDAQEKAGTLAAAEAEPLRTELKRRILTEGRSPAAAARPFATNIRAGIAIALAVAMSGAATWLYARLGNPELATTVTGPAAAEGGAPAADGGQAPPDVGAMVAQLEQRMKENPGDPEGWRMLGWSYFQLQRFADSATAYAKAAELKPGEAVYHSAQGEALVQAANGAVTPAAKAAFETARKLDPTDARSRFFLALGKEQQGDVKGAVDDWISLLNESPADAPYAQRLREIVGEAAQKAGLDISGRIKVAAPVAQEAPPGGVPPTPMRGPSPEQVQAAQQMDPNDRQAMVRGMVEGLDARLRANPRDRDGWVRLMRARMVLGESGKAAEAYRAARAAYSDDPGTLEGLQTQAKQMGVPGA
jgi:cytochrome c-type biogenesis protein CcmH